MSSAQKLRKVLAENPDLPILFFVSENAYKDNGNFSQASYSCEIQELALSGNDWISKNEWFDLFGEVDPSDFTRYICVFVEETEEEQE